MTSVYGRKPGRKKKAGSKRMYSYQSRIRYSELDEAGRLKIESLLDYFQDCSTFQSEDLGLGVARLQKEHLVWVLSSWQIVVERYPKLGETVTLGTLPYEFKGFIGYRNFLMSDQAGNRLACANTVWSLLDTRTNRPVRPTEEMLRGYVLEPRLAMDYAPRRIALPGEMTKGEAVTVRKHHLDTNHHVNNGQYVKIAMESLGKEFPVRQLRAEYKKQSFLGDVLIPYTAKTAEGTFVIALKNQAEESCCIVELTKKEE